MDHTKINFDLIVELMAWLVTGNHKDLNVSQCWMSLLSNSGFNLKSLPCVHWQSYPDPK